MNDAHWHLVVNHFPIIGTIIGLGILLAGIILKNRTAVNIAYLLFVVTAIFGFASMYTGEGAEEMVEDLPNVGELLIHNHEEAAEKLAAALYILGTVSALGLILGARKVSLSRYITYVALVVAVVAVIMAKEVGTTGGEVRHTEIRENGSAGQQNTTAGAPEVEEED